MFNEGYQLMSDEAIINFTLIVVDFTLIVLSFVVLLFTDLLNVTSMF